MELALHAGIAVSTLLGATLMVLGISQLRQARRWAAAARVEQQIGAVETPGPQFTRPADVLRERQQRSSIQAVDSLLRRSSRADRIALDLAQANVKLKVFEYVLIRLLLGAAAFVMIGWVNTLWVAVPVAVLAFYAPKFWLVRRRSDRLNKFNDQIVDMLGLLANSLKAGYGLGQAIENTARELAPPISEELHRVTRDINLGINPETALANLMHRMPSYDLELIVTSMLIQRKTGGNLAQVLENIAGTIRDRIKVMGEMRTLTAEGRLSGYILAVMPFFMLLILQFINPEYMQIMTGDTIGRLLLLASFVMIVIGFFVIRRMCDIRV